jgi:dTDP-4-amino-4,6-dideoxygalactose transaminase
MREIGVGTFETTDKMRKLVNKVLDTGRLSYGPMSKKFEKKFAYIRGVKYAVLSNSGTSALQIALQAMKEIHGWNDGDEVIVPASTFVATANIVIHNNMVPVFVDVDPMTYNISWTRIEENITEKTRAIIPVHLYGHPAEMIEIMHIAKSHDLKVIEDSCECAFARHEDRMVGSWGDIACFSTYMAHLVTTGVGGISVTNNPEYAAKMRSLANHGRDGIYISIDDDNNVSELKKNEIISKRFKFDSVGHSFRVTELEAALGLAQLETWQEMILDRNANAFALNRMLEDLVNKIQLPSMLPRNEHDFMMYPIVLYNEDKWKLCNHLEKHGIETREMMPLINQPVYEDFVKGKTFAVAEWINHSGFYIGCHQGLDIHDMEYISDVIHSYFGDK